MPQKAPRVMRIEKGEMEGAYVSKLMEEKLGSLGGKNAASMFGMLIPTRKKKSHVFGGDQFRDH